MRCKARSRIVIRKGAEKLSFSKKRRENMKAVTHCIFDLDGLLQDTEERLAKLLDQNFKKSDQSPFSTFENFQPKKPLYTRAISKCLSKFGAEFTEELELSTTGTTGRLQIIWLFSQSLLKLVFCNRIFGHTKGKDYY